MIDGATKLVCLLGHPVIHSLSPIIHNQAFRKKKLNYVYLAFQIRNYEDLQHFIKGLRGIDNFVGANITTPFKEVVVELLDELSPEAEQIGAVNTIKKIDSKLKGYNTDGYGFTASLREAQIDITNKSVLLIGAGGAGRAVAFAICKKNIKEIFLTSKTGISSKKLQNDLDKTYAKVRVEHIDFADIKKIIKNIDMIINATPVGLSENETLISRELLREDMIVYDLNYKEKQTRLLKEAALVGATTLNGLSMLIHQAVASFKIWTDMEAPLQVMKEACSV